MTLSPTIALLLLAPVISLANCPPASAEDCDDACYLIQNTIDTKALQNFIAERPRSQHFEAAESRLKFLRRALSSPLSGFGDVKKTQTLPVPQSQMPQKNF
jgi:hypothetical protein